MLMPSLQIKQHCHHVAYAHIISCVQSGSLTEVLLAGILLAGTLLASIVAKPTLCFNHARCWLHVRNSCYWGAILAKGIRTLVHIDSELCCYSRNTQSHDRMHAEYLPITPANKTNTTTISHPLVPRPTTWTHQQRLHQCRAKEQGILQLGTSSKHQHAHLLINFIDKSKADPGKLDMLTTWLMGETTVLCQGHSRWNSGRGQDATKRRSQRFFLFLFCCPPPPPPFPLQGVRWL